MPFPASTLYPKTSGLYPGGVAESTPGGAVTPLGQRGMQVLIGGRDLTNRCDSLVFSAVDRGGFEICTLGLPAADRPKKGEAVTIRVGLSVAWAGRVAEIADHSIHGRSTKTTGCEGWQALLKDNPYSMVYVDRELGQWKAPSVAQQIKIISEFNNQRELTVAQDPISGAPSVLTGIAAPWNTGGGMPVAEGWYDAGAGNLISLVFYAWRANPNTNGETDANWTWFVATSSDDQYTQQENTGNLRGAGSGSGEFLTQSPRRFAAVQLRYSNASVTGNQSYGIYWQLAAYGNHGLPRRAAGPGPTGFYPSDIARHALAQTAGIETGVIVDSTGYIVPHAVYRTPTPAAQVIEDMAKLMGWSWGVWGPSTVLGSAPRLDFRPPASDATAVISKAECDELDITARLGDLYDTCIVSFTDAAGSAGQATVTLPNPQLYEAGIGGRTLLLDAGASSQEAARTLGNFALSLSQVSARGAGQATLPAYVRLVGGGSKPAFLLRPGIDRLRISDLADGGPLFLQGNERRDIFHIKRIETTVTADGAPNTRVELDTGTNLLEVLQARLSLAAGVVGSGASGG